MFAEFLCKYVVFQLLCLFLAAPHCNGHESCNEGRGECKALVDCPPIKDNFIAMLPKIQFCNMANSIVCCPKSIKLTRPSPVELSARSEIECVKNRAVFGECPPKPFIVNGRRVEEGEFPFIAALGVREETGQIDWKCTGSLITPRYVITAAHCFNADVILNHVCLGDLDHSTDKDDAHRQDFTIAQYTEHPKYDYEKSYNDIALVLLNDTARLNRFVVPACLPLTNGAEFTHFLAAGWGADRLGGQTNDLLFKTQVEHFSDSECKGKIPSNLDGLVERTQICAGSHSDKNDTCQGDSGGPLFVQHVRYPCLNIVVGVTSFGGACGNVGLPGVYTRVQKYVDWIERVVWGLDTT